MTGASASTIRAGILASVLLIAEWLGRYVGGIRPLVLTACLMLVMQPLWGMYNLGFQLSFLAVVGILVFSDLLTTFSQGMAATTIREYTGETIAAQLMVTPLLLWSFGEISLVSILGNVLIIPVIPIVMIGGFISSVVYAVIPVSLVGYPVLLLIQWVLWLTERVASIPSAMITVPNFGILSLMLGYLSLAGIYWGMRRIQNKKRLNSL
jgi:competence protein ComEC